MENKKSEMSVEYNMDEMKKSLKIIKYRLENKF